MTASAAVTPVAETTPNSNLTNSNNSKGIAWASSPLGQARNANVAKFRREYETANIGPDSGYNGNRHFVSLHIVVLTHQAICLWLLYRSTPSLHDVPWAGATWTIVLSFLLANLCEYAKHRFDMHHPLSKSDHSPVHHRYFTANSMYLTTFNAGKAIFFRVSFILTLFYIIMPIPALILNYLVFPTCGYYFLLTSTSYYLQYEWLHLIYHCPPDSIFGRLPFVQYLRRHHRIHHHQPLMRTHNFNITYPLMDVLFRTSYTGPPVFSEEMDMTPPPAFVQHVD